MKAAKKFFVHPGPAIPRNLTREIGWDSDEAIYYSVLCVTIKYTDQRTYVENFWNYVYFSFLFFALDHRIIFFFFFSTFYILQTCAIGKKHGMCVFVSELDLYYFDLCANACAFYLKNSVTKTVKTPQMTMITICYLQSVPRIYTRWTM